MVGSWLYCVQQVMDASIHKMFVFLCQLVCEKTKETSASRVIWTAKFMLIMLHIRKLSVCRLFLLPNQEMPPLFSIRMKRLGNEMTINLKSY